MIASDYPEMLLQLLAAALVTSVVFLWTALWELLRIKPSSPANLKALLHATIDNPIFWVLGIPAFGASLYLTQ